MNLPPIALFLIEGIALYVLIAAGCIANRMTAASRFVLRVIVTGMAILALWGLLRTIFSDWPPTTASLAHLAALILATIWLLKNPRIPTEPANSNTHKEEV